MRPALEILATIALGLLCGAGLAVLAFGVEVAMRIAWAIFDTAFGA